MRRMSRRSSVSMSRRSRRRTSLASPDTAADLRSTEARSWVANGVAVDVLIGSLGPPINGLARRSAEDARLVPLRDSCTAALLASFDYLIGEEADGGRYF